MLGTSEKERGGWCGWSTVSTGDYGGRWGNESLTMKGFINLCED